MVARTVGNNCVTIISLFQLSGGILEWSWTPAAQICVLLIAMYSLFFFSLKNDFWFCPCLIYLEFQALLDVLQQPFQGFSHCALICGVQGRREVNKCHPVCLPCATDVHFQLHAEEKTIKIRYVYVTKCFWGQVFKCNIVGLFLASCCPYSAV